MLSDKHFNRVVFDSCSRFDSIVCALHELKTVLSKSSLVLFDIIWKAFLHPYHMNVSVD